MSYPILYEPTEKTFDHNGIGVLSDCSYCMVEEEANGQFEMKLKYPSNGIHFDKITYNSIIKAKLHGVDTPQLFRVYEISNSIKNLSTILARHISYDLSGIPVSPFEARNATEAFAGLKANSAIECPFDFWTDKTTESDFSVLIPSSIRSVLGGSQGSVLDIYGGEYEFDNYNVKLYNKRGQDRGFCVRYGKNLKTLNQEKNCENVYTGVYPFWQNYETNEIVQLPEKILKADGVFPLERIKILDFSYDFEEKPTEEQIRSKAKKYISDGEIGKPDVSLDVSFVKLETYEEYSDLVFDEKISVFDEVTVIFEEMKISTKAKVSRIIYNVIFDNIETITIGKHKMNVADTISKISKTVGFSSVLV